MSIYETSITNPKKQLEFYKQLSEQLQQENKQLRDNLSEVKEELKFQRKMALPVSTYAVSIIDQLMCKVSDETITINNKKEESINFLLHNNNR